MPLNSWTKKFLEKPLELLRAFSVSPPDGYVKKTTISVDPTTGRNLIDYYGGMSKGVAIEMGGKYTRLFGSAYRGDVEAANGQFKAAKVEVPVGWIRLEPSTDPRLAGALTFTVEMGDQAGMADEMAKTAERAVLRGQRLDEISWADKDKIPVYFLPWESRTLVTLNIPEYKEENVVSYGDKLSIDPLSPHLFFTAAINGCSVFVNGDARRPSVTHAGISQGSTPYGDEAATFWRDLIQAHHLQQRTRGDVLYEVNKKNYVNATSKAGGAWTPLSARFRTWLNKVTSGGPLKVDQVVPWGAVFGIRYGRLWSFYLQENVTVMRYLIEKKTVTKTETRQVPKKNIFGKPTSKIVTEEFEVEVTEEVKDFKPCNVPLRVSPFFPKGPARVEFKPQFKRVI